MLRRQWSSARVDAVGVWTGKELVVFGGTDARTITANHVAQLTDGAALRPA